MTIIDVARELEKDGTKLFRSKAPGIADGWLVCLEEGWLSLIYPPLSIVEDLPTNPEIFLATDWEEVKE